MSKETTYNSASPYPNNGYRSDCTNIKFNQVMYRREDTQVNAYFTPEEPGVSFTLASTNYFATGGAFGNWVGSGAATSAYPFQMGVCDSATDLSPGIWFSGNTQNCFKQCGYWCYDTNSQYFRAQGTSTAVTGTAFAENGHTNVGSKVISVAVRYVPQTINYGMSAAKAGLSCMDIKTQYNAAPDGVYYIKPSGVATAFMVWCDMTTDGGGWTMCYTLNSTVRTLL